MPDSRDADADTPGVPFPPPVAYLAALAIGFAIHYLRPLHILTRSGIDELEAGGAIVFLAGCALGAWGLLRFRLARTCPFPDQPTTALVIRGPYRFTRNPMYIAMALIHAGAALFSNALLPLLLLAPALIVIRYQVIAREETYLRKKFGPAYEAYCSRVRRWL